jgi:hypothetical protein
MYTCMITGKTSKRGEKLNHIVVATRQRIYTEKVWEEGELVELEIGRGYEIVREINASNEGLAMWRAWSDDEKDNFCSRVLGLPSPQSYVVDQ